MLLMNASTYSRKKRNRFEIMSQSPHQARDSNVSERHESATKWLRTRVDNHACTSFRAQFQADRRRITRHRQKQSNLPTCAESFTLESLDPFPSAACRHIAALLQWCARMHIPDLQMRIPIPASHKPCSIRYKR